MSQFFAQLGFLIAALSSKAFSYLGKMAERPQRKPRPARPSRLEPPQLTKKGPATLEQRYRILHDGELADEVFLRLRQTLYDAVDQVDRISNRFQRGGNRVVGRQVGPAAKPRAVFREAGRIAPDRPYFYLKPAGETGLLFERSGAGWVICKAEKIIDRNLFLREGDPIDNVSLYFATDRPAMPRVLSKRLGSELLPLAVYEQKLRQTLGLDQAG